MSDEAFFRQYWTDRIERDIRPFADPGTKLDLANEGRTIIARWYSRHKPLEARFVVSPEQGVSVSFEGNVLTYRSFLAAPAMSDLLSIAKMVLQVRKKGIFVATKAKINNEIPKPALNLLNSLLDDDLGDLTRIVMVTGEAGAGKTSVLQELVRVQAEQYIRGLTDVLYLYVNAQGRALARFNEALAAELQDLRATVTYHAVATLVRAGIMVPIIDGFDELLGVGGYDDAFSSLSGFIEELNGAGQIVASARSTYYEQEFVARASTVSSLGAQAWSQIPAEVQAWGEQEYDEYLKFRFEDESLDENKKAEIRTRIDSAFSGKNEDLRHKPLFLARTVDLVIRGEVALHSERDLLEQLVDAYLERERKEKLLDRSGAPLLSAEDIYELLTDLAEEMWNQETRELDKRSVKEVAEYSLVTRNIGETSQRVVIERMPTLAFLMTGDLSGGIAFEHEMFFSFFLSRRFASKLANPEARLGVTFGRSILPSEVADTTVDMYWRETPTVGVKELQEVLLRLTKTTVFEGPRATQVRENAGLIGASAIRYTAKLLPTIKGITVKGLVFPGVKLGAVEFVNCNFEDVSFRRMNLSRVRFLNCVSTNSYFNDVVVDPSYTKLGLLGLEVSSQVQGLKRVADNEIESIYNPETLHDVLVACDAIKRNVATPNTRQVNKEVIELLQRLARAYGHRNPICIEDSQLQRVFASQFWPNVRKLLIKHSIIVSESRPTHGRPKEFLRRQFLPDQIMSGASTLQQAPPSVNKFWSELEHMFPG